MKFEEVNIFQEKADQLIMVLHSVERRDPQKLVKLLLWGWQLNSHLSNKILIRYLYTIFSKRPSVWFVLSCEQCPSFGVCIDSGCNATAFQSIFGIGTILSPQTGYGFLTAFRHFFFHELIILSIIMNTRVILLNLKISVTAALSYNCNELTYKISGNADWTEETKEGANKSNRECHPAK